MKQFRLYRPWSDDNAHLSLSMWTSVQNEIASCVVITVVVAVFVEREATQAAALQSRKKKCMRKPINEIPPEIAKYFKVKCNNIHMQNTQHILLLLTIMMQQIPVNQNIYF